jgi:hypothetical protein
MVKFDHPGAFLKAESSGWAQSDASTAMRAAAFITDNVLPQGLYLYSCIYKVFYTFVIVSPFTN